MKILLTTATWGRLLIEEMLGRADPDLPRLREALEVWPNDPRIAELARRWGAPKP